MSSIENESWIIDRGGEIVEECAMRGFSNLTPWKRLVYCLWVADYGMQNAGDLDVSTDLFEEFRSEAIRAAEELSLPLSKETFSLSQLDLETEYFERFDQVCVEIRAAE